MNVHLEMLRFINRYRFDNKTSEKGGILSK